jgi:hypothetical protein
LKTFFWLPVYGASEYVAKLDEVEPFGIAVSTIDPEEGKICYYTQSTDDLANGLHTISFAARTDKDALSDWTDVLSFYVNKTSALSRPELSNSFAVCSNEGFDTITYTVK